MFPTLKKSLCGASLYTGSLILAWLYTIASFAGFLLVAVTAARGTQAYEEDFKQKVSKEAFGIFLAVFMGIFLINVCLLVGVYKKNRYFMIPHMILAFFAMMVMILYNFLLLMVAFKSVPNFVRFTVHILQFALMFYLFLIIESYYKSLKAESTLNQEFKKLDEE